ncbi:FAD-dependent oxidoreductase, partial [Clostridium saudiense]|nr:FAD-dependent oxidoreductase [Clostridium saudiense]
IHKYTGIFSTASAHRLVNFQGLLPGREVILSGNTVWSYILARRLVIEGAKVKGIITSRESVSEDLARVIEGFDVPVICNSEVVEVGGGERIEWARVENCNKKEESKIIECDSLILAIGYYPEIDYLKNSNIKINQEDLEIENYKTSVEGIYCCGTIIHGRNGLFTSGEDGYKVGKIVSEQLK